MKYLRLFGGPRRKPLRGRNSRVHSHTVRAASTTGCPPTGSKAERIGFLRFAPGWRGNLHPAPRRQFLVWLAGSGGCQASNGEIRQVGAGDVLLVEDTTGKGHSSRNAGDDVLLAAAIQLVD
jgi:quercetin dioxygenase-like cupin family protein